MTLQIGAMGLDPEQTEAVLAAAARAPSLHNSQPWRFRLRPHSIELHADLDRQLPVADPDGRELRMTCGAALFNLRLAVHGLGVRPVVTIFPDARQPALLAAVRHGGRKAPTPQQRQLLQAVSNRHTNRRPFTDIPVSPAERHALRRAAIEEGCWWQTVDDPAQRGVLRELAARAHRKQLTDPDFVAELARWTNTGPDRRDGVPAWANGPQGRWTLRDFAADRMPGGNAEHEPTIGVLTPGLAGSEGEIRTGQALQRVLLTATGHGLAASLLSQLVEVAPAREEVRRLIGSAQPPLAVLRIGRGWPVPATPRIPVSALVIPDPPEEQR